MAQPQPEKSTIGECPAHVAEAIVAMSGSPAPAVSRARVAPVVSPAAVVADGKPCLMVLGLPPSCVELVRDTLCHWADQGRHWVGAAQQWHVQPVLASDPGISGWLATQQRWALWVDTDAEAFRRAWRHLLALVEAGGPRQLLLIHPRDVSRAGLLENLQQAAAQFLDVELVVLA